MRTLALCGEDIKQRNCGRFLICLAIHTSGCRSIGEACSTGHNRNVAPYTFLENIETEVPIPDNGILSRTLFNDEALKVVAFGFSLGHELSAHTAPMAAILYFIRGEAELTLGTEKKNVRAGAFVHMPPQTPHGILAKTSLAMLLLMMKQIRQNEPSQTIP